MRKFIWLLLLTVAFMANTTAQRFLPEMKGVQFTASAVDGFQLKNDDGQAFASGFALSVYKHNGNRWLFGGEFLQKKYAYGTELIPVRQFTAEGGYYLNLLTDRSRTLAFSLGFSALAGYETVNNGKKMLYDGAMLEAGEEFLYGGAITLEIETYLSDRCVFLIHARERYLPPSTVSEFNFQWGIGFKFIIN